MAGDVRAVIKGAPRDEVIARITTTMAPAPRPEAGQAAEVLRTAYEAARRLQEAAQVEAARAVAEAQARARAELEAAWGERLRRLDRLLDDLSRQAPASLAEQFAPAVVTLALEVARKVIRRAVECDPALLLGWVREAAERLHASGALVVRVNPQDLERLRSSGVDLERAGVRLRWVADPSVDGGCVVESDSGVVDATVATQLRTLQERLEEVSGA
ncbi:MAG: flagellar assembly protein FliH [Armatimonadota bacterium]|nr:flagellar assembly protein FliH [Armatimonadota bacterium]MDR7529157.1 flagellar assembly protein FliH [Armatimonadota bacterium]MDR7616497.1 flagellar assembly protein FliH [Armatimonadota bacterium]